MTHNSPPRRVELLLEALGAAQGFRDEVIGDLAEEFSWRVERDGRAPARRWYYREALRVAPHLLTDWRRGVGRADVKRLGSVIALSYMCVVMLGMFGVLTVNSILLALRIAPEYPWSPGRGPLSFSTTALLLLVITTQATIGGYVAATLERRAPLTTAMVLGLAWSALALASRAISMPFTPPASHPLPLWYQLAGIALLVVGASVGGAVRVATSARQSENAKPVVETPVG
jgi:hypothetical protein